MRNITLLLSVVALAALISGCAYIPGGTDLSDVADEVGLINVTTGDGTFENYKATGHFTGTEVGIALGIPGIGKFLELYPIQSNEDLLINIADEAKDDGADAMINVTPHKEFYSGFPFFFLGIYVDACEGTGIKTE
jgi:hypothetical protein